MVFHKKTTLFSFFRKSLKWWPIFMKFLPVVAQEILIQHVFKNMAVDWIFFASRDVILTSWCVSGTSLQVSTGAVSCYPALMLKNLVYSWKLLEVLQLQPQKCAKQSHLRDCGDSWTFTCSGKTVHLHTELARRPSFWIAIHLVSCPHVA